MKMHGDIVRILLKELHQSVNRIAVYKCPPLTLAIDDDDAELVSYLLGRAEISVNHVDRDGKYPLDYVKSRMAKEQLQNAGAVRAPHIRCIFAKRR